jgi:hypothetical protein
LARFLIELEHEATNDACYKAYNIILSTGSHFLSNAEWGCEDNVHCCWIIADLDTKDEARAILPPIYRNDAKITEIKRYKLEDFKHSDSFHS